MFPHREQIYASLLVLQGTAATAVAGLYGALAVQGKKVGAITEQTFVVVGAGSAGMGVVSLLTLGMIKHVSLSFLGPSCF